MIYDVFNGDADGIFSLHQYRLSFPATGNLVTGVKRDIKLLNQIDDCESDIHVFDISLDSNRSALFPLLEKNNTITWFDHHFAGDIPETPHLTTFINSTANICTSLIVNSQLGNRYPSFAICGAFGDNLHQPARELAARINLSENQTSQLAELGELFNYNGYGVTLEDLHFHPRQLYEAIRPYTSPFEFIAESRELKTLRDGYANDMALAESVPELHYVEKNRMYFFPNESWARRVSGVFSNMKAREMPNIAHAIITDLNDVYRISVRAPLSNRHNADALCRAFPTGGGRAAAAGINSLPKSELDRFITAFGATYNTIS